ncbi:MAG: tetratricopeptide repeat protein [Burkholderiales bacterium]
MLETSKTQSINRLLSQVRQAVDTGNFERAVEIAEIAVNLAPNEANTWNALGVALRASGRPQSALLMYRRAFDVAGQQPTTFGGNFANALTDLGRFEEAIAWHENVVGNIPSSHGWNNFGRTLRKAARYERALEAYEESIRLNSENYDSQFGRAMALLALGDYARGWPAFEFRMRLPEFRAKYYPPDDTPYWDGRPLPADSALFIWPEQGFGDSILSTRFLPLIRKHVGRILLGVKPELKRLFQGLSCIDELVQLGEAIPAHTAHAPIMSLARHVMTSLGDLPPPIPFHVPAEATEKVAPLLARAEGRTKVGIVWSGSHTFSENSTRAVKLERFLPLAEIPGVQLFSLQKGPKAQELADARVGAAIIDLAPYLSDFADTAAAVQALDLIIMTDSSVAHLAGSLSKPVWNLLSHATYWLYLQERSDSPWYPSMRLFRQPSPGDWDSVFCSVKSELAIFSEQTTAAAGDGKK